MDKFKFHFKYALRSLLRDETRTILAIFCVAFGTLSIVAMQTLTNTFDKAINIDPHYALGADVQLTKSQDNFNESDYKIFDDYVASGDLGNYTAYINGMFGMVQSASGKMQTVYSNYGIDAAKYPFYGSFGFTTDTTMGAAIAELNSVAITDDLATSLNLKIGDTFSFKSYSNTEPVNLKVTAIINKASNMLGHAIYYNMDTAKLLSGSDSPQLTVLLKEPSQAMIKALTDMHKYYFTTTETVSANTADTMRIFSFAFNGAGVLGLTIGGIGIANTLQVVMKRRLNEIGILKTVGFKKKQLFRIFILETLIMGLIGSIIGAGLALVFADQLTGMLRATGSGLISTAINWLDVVMSILAGTLTAAIFGSYAIIQVVEYKPIAIFRDELNQRKSKLKSLGVLFILYLLFTGISAYILKSALNGLIITAATVAGSLILGLLLKLILKLALLIPLPTPNLFRFPKAHLKKNLNRMIFPIIALVAGIAAIIFTANVVNTAKKEVTQYDISVKGLNVTVYSTLTDNSDIVSAFRGMDFIERYALTATTVDTGSVWQLESRSNDNFSYEVDEKISFANKYDTYVPVYNGTEYDSENGIPVGSTIRISYAGKDYELKVAGYYTMNALSTLADPVNGLLISRELFSQMDSQATPVYLARLDSFEQNKVYNALCMHKGVTVYTEDKINELTESVYSSLFSFVTAVASLALVAGAVLIANTVGIDLLERQKEIGIIKALGYTRKQVLLQLLFEYGFIGVIAGIFGVIVSAIMIPVMNSQVQNLGLVFDWKVSLIMMLVSIAIAILATLLVAYRPTKVKPLTVLRAE